MFGKGLNELCLTHLIMKMFPIFANSFWTLIWYPFQIILHCALINPFPSKSWFLCVCSTSLENTMGEREIARNERFYLFPHCFLPFWRTVCHFHQIYNCRLSVWKSLKYVVCKRIKYKGSCQLNMN